MNPLVRGGTAPVFDTVALDGTLVSVPASGAWTLLSFLRYASCPMCNLRVRELRLRDQELKSAGVTWLAVFHSPSRRLMRYFSTEVRSHVVADPGRVLYARFDVGYSWWRTLASVLVPTFFWRLLKATAFGYWGGAIDHSIHSMPADFLVSPTGAIRLVHYGRHIGDHVAVSDVLTALVDD